MKKLLIFSTFLEAKETLGRLNATLRDGLWHYSEGAVVISGMGEKNAFEAAHKHGLAYDSIYNIGIAGALRDLPFGSLHKVSLVGKSSNKPLTVHSEGVSLYTSDVPIHNKLLREELALHWDLVDMEGYGVVQAAQSLSKPCTLYKLVSDFATEGGSALIKKHLSEHSLKLSQLF